VSARAGGVPNDACITAAISGRGVQTVAYYECNAAASNAYAACLAASGGCLDDARTACDDVYNDATGTCVYPDDTTAYDDALAACQLAIVVGSGADSCSDTAAASTATGDAVFTGTTLLANNHRMAGKSCGTDPTADISRRWTATVAGMYRIDTFGSKFDTVLRVFATCDGAAAEVACDEDGYLGARMSEITRMFTAGQTVQIVVDGSGPDDAGDYRVNIHAM